MQKVKELNENNVYFNDWQSNNVRRKTNEFVKKETKQNIVVFPYPLRKPKPPINLPVEAAG